MGKRYYCDYCDKSFADNAQNRRKHIQGGQHQSLIKLHYHAFKDPEEILTEESEKKPCQRFNRSGDCTFGINCRFSHLTAEGRNQLLYEIDQKRMREFERLQHKTEEEQELEPPTLEDWLGKRSKRQKTGDKADSTTEGGGSVDETAQDCLVFKLPPSLQGRTDLPPSLIPPSVECVIKAKDLEWGS